MKPVVISYADLCNADVDLHSQIEEGFGYAGLGLLLVSGVPNLVELREALLPLGTNMANLSDEAKAKVEVPKAMYSVGWSHGKEKLKEGTFGMFYSPAFRLSFTSSTIINHFHHLHPSL